MTLGRVEEMDWDLPRMRSTKGNGTVHDPERWVPARFLGDGV